jgi:hypothetical protein
MSPTSNSATETVRRALLKIDDATIIKVVDGLDLRGQAKISAVIGIPLRKLQQQHDVPAFAGSAPIAALRALLELLAMEPLERVIERLGGHADTPTFDQLSGAIDALVLEGMSSDDVVAVLAFAIAEEFAAAPHCRRLLEERSAFALPELPDVAVTSHLLTPKQTDPEVRAQRQRRREEEKARKRGPSSARPPRPTRAKASPVPTPAPPVRVVPESKGRRKMLLTPSESERFSADHALAGSVVVVEVPFDATDPLVPEQKSKDRPALVVAAADDALLVRPIYSQPGPTRTVFHAWRRLGLDHVSYVDDARVVVAVGATASPERVGRLNDQEWNALF